MLFRLARKVSWIDHNTPEEVNMAVLIMQIKLQFLINNYPFTKQDMKDEIYNRYVDYCG
jgi:hypothetical protein